MRVRVPCSQPLSIGLRTCQWQTQFGQNFAGVLTTPRTGAGLARRGA